jgi:uncharacterized membrane protein YhaH (DUF805 family)
MADGKCPSCGESIQTPDTNSAVKETTQKPIITSQDFYDWQQDSEKPQKDRYADGIGRGDRVEANDNPYLTPRSDFPETSPSVFGDSAQRKGLRWILFSFQGRIPRSTYWAASIGLIVLSYALLTGLAVVGMVIAAELVPPDPDPFAAEPPLLNILFVIWFIPWAIVTLWIQFAIQAKRCHDRDKSAWWILMGMVPYIGPLWAFIELGCLEGYHGRNQYGPDPLPRKAN